MSAVFSGFVTSSLTIGLVLAPIAIYTNIRPTKTPKKTFEGIGFFLIFAALLSVGVMLTELTSTLTELSRAIPTVAPEEAWRLGQYRQNLINISFYLGLANLIPFTIGILTFIRGRRLEKPSRQSKV